MQALDAFLPRNSGERKTLADVIFAKLNGNSTSEADITEAPTRPSK